MHFSMQILLKFKYDLWTVTNISLGTSLFACLCQIKTENHTKLNEECLDNMAIFFSLELVFLGKPSLPQMISTRLILKIS